MAPRARRGLIVRQENRSGGGSRGPTEGLRTRDRDRSVAIRGKRPEGRLDGVHATGTRVWAVAVKQSPVEHSLGLDTLPRFERDDLVGTGGALIVPALHAGIHDVVAIGSTHNQQDS